MRKLVCIFGAVLLALAAGSAWGDTLQFSLTADGCSGGGCGAGPYGTVTITDDGSGNVNLSEQLNAGYYFVNTGAGNANSLDYNLSTAGTSYTNLNSNLGTSYFSFAGADSSGSFGSFSNSIECPGCGSGASKVPNTPQMLSFTIDGISTSDFTKTTKGYYFASDVADYNSVTQKVVATGSVAADSYTNQTPVVPEPASLFLLGTGLFVLFGLVKLRGRNSEAKSTLNAA